MPPKLVVDIELLTVWKQCFQCGNKTFPFLMGTKILGKTVTYMASL